MAVNDGRPGSYTMYSTIHCIRWRRHWATPRSRSKKTEAIWTKHQALWIHTWQPRTQYGWGSFRAVITSRQVDSSPTHVLLLSISEQKIILEPRLDATRAAGLSSSYTGKEAISDPLQLGGLLKRTWPTDTVTDYSLWEVVIWTGRTPK